MAVRLLGVGTLLGLVLLLQLHSGAYESEFGSYPDEAPHVVTGLMAHDFLVGLDWSAPMRFAENFYLHYPEVALGHWPPFFYLLQALWTITFGVSRTSLLLMMAVIGTALGVLVFQAGRRLVGRPLAVAAVLVLLTLPFVQRYTAAVMTEILMALLALAAALAIGRYLEGRRPYRYALMFGVLASVAILTKGTGLLLGLVPPLTLIFARRYDCLRRVSFWVPAALVAVLCAPFYLFSLGMQRNGMQHESFEGTFFFSALPVYSAGVVNLAGVCVSVLALIGVLHRVALPRWRGEAVDPTWAALAGLLFSVWGFHLLVPCGLEHRHLVVLLPPLVLFAAAGFLCLWEQLDRLPLSARGVNRGVVAAVVVLGILTQFRLYSKEWHGCREAAAALERRHEWKNSVFMISSDPTGEGLLISEVALQDRRPNRYALRASKFLSTARWNGARYEQRFASVAPIHEVLKNIPVGLLILDSSMPPSQLREHHRQLRAMVEAFPDDWRFVGTYPLTRNGRVYPDALKVYSLYGHEQRPERNIEIDLRHMTGHTLRVVECRDPR